MLNNNIKVNSITLTPSQNEADPVDRSFLSPVFGCPHCFLVQENRLYGHPRKCRKCEQVNKRGHSVTDTWPASLFYSEQEGCQKKEKRETEVDQDLSCCSTSDITVREKR